ncbi:hypothetical protein [Bacteroides acidifaciens]|uniref:hypothetical protein n=1 Tax=Bacteroides acidifaciens TaxID=85831 RepID=UPI00158A915C|nr:hypothetical protein [Bacteroides acidifaciens]
MLPTFAHVVNLYAYHAEYIDLPTRLKATECTTPCSQHIPAGDDIFRIQPLSPSIKAFADKTETAETG